MADGICSIAGCTCRAFMRGWCHAHYQRWHRHGDPMGGSHAGRYAHRCRPPRPCGIEGCGRHHYSHGYCELHFLRWSKNDGDLAIVSLEGTRPRVLNGKWAGDDAGYAAVHERVKRLYGPASKHSCAQCDAQAVDWAYDHSCPNEKSVFRRGRTFAYSTDPGHYMPLCRSCHTRLDKGLESV